jgi:DNA repair exonuclease SbcCD ATPase subunit
VSGHLQHNWHAQTSAYRLNVCCFVATEAQQQAANDRGIAEAKQHELQQRLAEKDAALQHQRQLEQSWRFRQLEATTRALATLEHLQGKVEALDAAAATYAAAVQQQHDDQHSELEEQLSRLAAWAATAEDLSGTGSRINTALVHMAQQWVAKQQKLRSSDKGMQVITRVYLATCFHRSAPGLAALSSDMLLTPAVAQQSALKQHVCWLHQVCLSAGEYEQCCSRHVCTLNQSTLQRDAA